MSQPLQYSCVGASRRLQSRWQLGERKQKRITSSLTFRLPFPNFYGDQRVQNLAWIVDISRI